MRAPRGPEAALELRGVGKRYWQLHEQAGGLRTLLPFARPDRTELWALRDVDLTIGAGECVGIIGRNGAGKSTMLRLLAAVTRPTEGTTTIRGRVAPLLSVGVGFHPEMTGRENVNVNGLLLGLTGTEVAHRFDAIVDFAELHDAIDTPVKFYSSGMFMRLGFAVAAHVEPDVLLVDEVLAVGDLAFQLKCFDRMRELRAGGTTIVIVSHSMHAIRLLCPRAVLLADGRVDADGDVEDVIARHHAALSVAGGPGDPLPDGSAPATVAVVERHLVVDGTPTHALGPAQPAELVARLRFGSPVESPQIHFTVVAEDGTVAYEMRSALRRDHRRYEAGEEAEARVRFTSHLAGGSYRIHVTVSSKDGRDVLHRDATGLLVYVTPPLGTSGVADLQATITLEGTVLSDHPEARL